MAYTVMAYVVMAFIVEAQTLPSQDIRPDLFGELIHLQTL